MTTTELPPPTGLCRTCGASRKACDRLQDHRDRQCCAHCLHVYDTGPDLGDSSEAW